MQTLFNYLPLLNALFCLGIGLYVLSRNWKIAANIGFFVGMAALGGMEFAAYMGASTVHGVYASSYDKMFGAAEILLPASWFVFSLSFARAEASRSFERWRPVSIPLFALTALLLFLSVTDSGLAERVTSKGVGFWVSVFLVLSLTITLANLESTLRSADPARRGKIKFLLLGIGSILLFQLYAHSQYLLFPRLEQDFSAVQSTILFIACLLVTFSLVRHQLMDVDVFVSRDFVYHSFTVGAVGVYLLVVGLAGQAIKSVGGIPTLLSAVPVRFSHRPVPGGGPPFPQHPEAGEDLHREELLPAPVQLPRGVAGADRQVELQAGGPGPAPRHRRHVPADAVDRAAPASGCTTTAKRSSRPCRRPETNRAPRSGGSRGLVDALRERDYPVHMEEWKDLPEGAGIDPGPMEALRTMGIPILSPLVVGDRFVGILGLSGTLSKYPLDPEDYDLVKTVSKQAASSFLNAAAVAGPGAGEGDGDVPRLLRLRDPRPEELRVDALARRAQREGEFRGPGVPGGRAAEHLPDRRQDEADDGPPGGALPAAGAGAHEGRPERRGPGRLVRAERRARVEGRRGVRDDPGRGGSTPPR